MKSRIVTIVASLLLAFTILSVSFLKGVGSKLAFSPRVLSETDAIESPIDINYNLPFPGRVLPDSPLWYAKAIRDKVSHIIALNPSKKAELSLRCADKRVQMAVSLFENGKPDLGLETLAKSEMYLLESLGPQYNDPEFLAKVALSSLKHRELIEENIMAMSPEDLKPSVVKIADNTKATYTNAKNLLHSVGVVAPINPFETE